MPSDIVWKGAAHSELRFPRDEPGLDGYGCARAESTCGTPAIQILGRDGNDELFGGPGVDDLFGGDGNDKLDGDLGDDDLVGGGDDDFFKGGDGDDTMWGEDGNDRLCGGCGRDTLNGGWNVDSCRDKRGSCLQDPSNPSQGCHRLMSDDGQCKEADFNAW